MKQRQMDEIKYALNRNIIIGVINIKIIISPAKTMKIDNDDFSPRQMPAFIEEAQILTDYLQTLNYEELKSLWKASDKLVKQNLQRIEKMDLYNNLTPAIVAFEGLQYQYMGAEVLTKKGLNYIEEHLRILSGFYGILKPFDGIKPYRLEMGAKFDAWKYESLYEFWEEKIAKELFAGTDCIINLASKEYSKAIGPYLPKDLPMIDFTFGEIIDGRVIQKATFLKMARGEIVRFMAEENIKKLEDLKNFDRLNYKYREDLSEDNNYVFIKMD